MSVSVRMSPDDRPEAAICDPNVRKEPRQLPLSHRRLQRHRRITPPQTLHPVTPPAFPPPKAAQVAASTVGVIVVGGQKISLQGGRPDYAAGPNTAPDWDVRLAVTFLFLK